jgi:hypothetical protein
MPFGIEIIILLVIVWKGGYQQLAIVKQEYFYVRSSGPLCKPPEYSCKNDSLLVHSSKGLHPDSCCFWLRFAGGDPAEVNNHQKLPSHLSQHDRYPLLMTPEVGDMQCPYFQATVVEVENTSTVMSSIINSVLHINSLTLIILTIYCNVKLQLQQLK